MYSKLLKEAQFDELIRKKSVTEVAAYLKRDTSYSKILADINESEIHRRELESLLKKSLIEDYLKLFHFLKGSPEKFIEATFLRFEVEDLKMILRVLNTQRSGELVKESLVFLDKFNTIDLNLLIKSKTIPEFVENLKESTYYRVLKPFVEGKEYQSLFDMELALDMHYFMMIAKLKDKLLKGSDKKAVSESYGREVDILNLLWIYRCKNHFNLPKEVTLNHIIPVRYSLSKDILLDLADSKDKDEFLSIVSKTRYSSLFAGKEDRMWEISFADYTYKMYKSILRKNSFNFGTVMAYIHLKEIEIRNIISAIECIRYGLPVEETKKYIIGFWS